MARAQAPRDTYNRAMPRQPKADPKEEPKKKKRKMDKARAFALLRDAGDLVWRARLRLLIGLPILLINRAASIVLPGTTKYLIDDVIGKGRHDMLWLLALVSGGSAAIGALTDYFLAILLGMAAQRSITDLRKRVQQHVQRLPVSYFDSTKSGVLVSRVMSDAEGIRNLVGTGLLQLFGGFLTAIVATRSEEHTSELQSQSNLVCRPLLQKKNKT